jgi:hypothetical protein
VNALSRQSIHVWRLRILVAETRKIAPPKVVTENHNDIRTLRSQGMAANHARNAAGKSIGGMHNQIPGKMPIIAGKSVE